MPPEVEAAIDKRSSMAAIGNLNDYVKFQMAQGHGQGRQQRGGAGTELAVGMAIAQQMMKQQGGFAGAGGAGAAAPAPAAAPARPACPSC